MEWQLQIAVPEISIRQLLATQSEQIKLDDEVLGWESHVALENILVIYLWTGRQAVYRQQAAGSSSNSISTIPNRVSVCANSSGGAIICVKIS